MGALVYVVGGEGEDEACQEAWADVPRDRKKPGFPEKTRLRASCRVGHLAAACDVFCQQVHAEAAQDVGQENRRVVGGDGADYWLEGQGNGRVDMREAMVDQGSAARVVQEVGVV